MIRKIYQCCLFLPLILFAHSEIEVPLSTKTEQVPLYLSKISPVGSQYDSSYLSSVRDILLYDLTQSGRFHVVKTDSDKEIALDQIDNNRQWWKAHNIAYVVKIKAEVNRLKIFLFDFQDNKSSSELDVVLSGEISRDRGHIHALSDRIVYFFTQQPGIAATKILYTLRKEDRRDSKKWSSEVWICDYDGHNAQKVIEEEGYCVTPLFVPNKKYALRQPFLYVSYREGQPKIYHSFLDAHSGRPLLSLPGNQLLPSISPNADKIAFVSDAAGRPDLFMQYYDSNGHPKGKPLQLFSFARATQASSSFSPDGKMLAFVSDKDGSPRIYMLKVPESPSGSRPSVHLITKKNRDNVTPAWSYDGKKIAYSAKTNGVRQIWIYDFETEEEQQLTTDGYNKENPVWAYDNFHIIYNSEDYLSSELFMINLHNPRAQKISHGPGRKRFPSWGPSVEGINK
ncbi:MAG: Tol-Pal system protein TolB [Parachlamydiales bacterium]|nr:Tol-Pal system protein TolB [Parachlamydiales bacterium]